MSGKGHSKLGNSQLVHYGTLRTTTNDDVYIYIPPRGSNMQLGLFCFQLLFVTYLSPKPHQLPKSHPPLWPCNHPITWFLYNPPFHIWIPDVGLSMELRDFKCWGRLVRTLNIGPHPVFCLGGLPHISP